MVRIKKTVIAEGIFLLEFASQYELAATFLRFQEHYESRRFRGLVFTLEEYMDWYAKEFGNFTYFEDWAGFNIPASALTPFYEGRFDPLLRKELQFLDLFAQEDGDFYIIGIRRSGRGIDASTLRHELAHALFYTDGAYRKEVLAALRGHDTAILRRKIAKLGYARQMLTDEVQAQIISDVDLLTAASRRRLAPLQRRLLRIFRRHWDTARRPSAPRQS